MYSPLKTNVGKCVVDGCDKEQKYAHMCSRHYQRLRKYGSTEARTMRGLSAIERTRARSVTTPGGCWEYQGCKTWQGYGHVRDRGKMRLTHIVMYEEKYGPKPEGSSLDHLCRNRACCNPDHLEPVTHAENVRRGVSAETARLLNVYDPITRRIIGRKQNNIVRDRE